MKSGDVTRRLPRWVLVVLVVVVWVAVIAVTALFLGNITADIWLS